jgi:hypothetical protein
MPGCTAAGGRMLSGLLALLIYSLLLRCCLRAQAWLDRFFKSLDLDVQTPTAAPTAQEH